MQRRLNVIVIACGMMLATSLPAVAVCSIQRLVGSFGGGSYSYVYGPAAYCSNGYCDYPNSSVNLDVEANFWAIGHGNPLPGVGVDSGTLASLRLDLDGPAVLRGYPGYAAFIATSWSDSGVDGCIDTLPLADRCTAVALHDVDPSCVPYNDSCNALALLSAREINGNYDLTQPNAGPIDILPVPEVLPGGGIDIVDPIPSLELSVPAPQGLYLDPSCPSPIEGYKVYISEVPDGTGIPDLEDFTQWTIPAGGSGPGGSALPLGSTTTVVFGCGAPQQRVYIGYTYLFDSGFESPRIELIDLGLLSGGITPQCCVDADADGFCTFAEGIDPDCDDSNAAVGPGFPQLCGDGVNNDCNDPNWPSLAGTDEADNDGDGVSACDGDCDPIDGSIFPGNGALERCDGRDNNCDGNIDNGAVVVRRLSPPLEGGDQFGFSAATIGDDDGDGRDDIVVGARGATLGGLNGIGWVFSSATLEWTNFFGAKLNAGGGEFGTSVARVGDIDGNGQEEVLVGGPGLEAAPGASFGGAFVVFNRGSAGFGGEDPVATGDDFGDRFGFAVAGVGDVNGDFVPDIAVGAREANGKGSATIQSVLGIPFSLLLEDPDGQLGDQFGYSLARIDDVNGDGADDLLVGAYLADSTFASDTGEVFLFSGATGQLLDRFGDPDGVAGDEFGRSIAAVDDADDDGLQDLLVGAPGFDSFRGQAVLLSSATGAVLDRLEDPAGEAGDYFGLRLATVHDLDGDGTRDWIVGAFLDDTGRGANAGSVIPFSGATGAPWPKFVDPLGQVGSQLGVGLTAVPDVDGDGRGDVLFGSHLWDGPEGVNSGAALIVSGAALTDLDGDSVGDLCDLDIDGDGIDNGTDCDPRDPLFSDTVEVDGVRFGAVDARLLWDDVAPDTTYAVYEGDLFAGPNSAACVAGGIATTVFTTSTISPGEGRFYLVATEDSCASTGSTSAGTGRPLPACP